MIIPQKQTLKEIFNEKYLESNDKMDFMFNNLFLYNDYDENKTQENYDILKNKLEGKSEVTVIKNDFKCCGQEMVYDSTECNYSCIHCGQMEQFMDLQMTYQDKVNLKPPQYRYNRNFHFMKLIVQYPKDLQEKIMKKFDDIAITFNNINKEENKVRNLPCFNYILYKILELLEEKDLLKNYKLKKSREKIKCLDSDFRNVCKRNNWVFYLTV